MKFISKSTNLRVVLQSELAPQPLSGFPGRSGITVRFQGGLAEVDDPKLIELMLNHPAFNIDFISAEETSGADPFAYLRAEAEPQHVTTEMRYGMPEKRITSAKNLPLPPEAMKVVQDLALDMAKSMLPGMMEAYLKALADKTVATNATQAPVQAPKAAGKPGRPRKVNTTPAPAATE